MNKHPSPQRHRERRGYAEDSSAQNLRTFGICGEVSAVALMVLVCGLSSPISAARKRPSAVDVAAFDRGRILKAANQYLKEMPVTITSTTSSRSAGGMHDYFSEGDYWWICQLLSTPEDNLWTFQLADGRGMRKAMDFMAPYIRNKKSWPYPSDVMYDEHWPMRQSSLLVAGLALGRAEYIELWKKLPADSKVEEVVRNFFVRQPVLWVLD